MLPLAANGRACIYCTFRQQQLRLQSFRTRQRLHLNHSAPRHAEAGVIRYTGRKAKVGIYAPPQPAKFWRPESISKKANKESVIRQTNQQGIARDSKNGTRSHGGGRFAFGKQTFDDALREKLKTARDELKDTPLLKELRKEDATQAGGRAAKTEDFSKIWTRFTSQLLKADDEPLSFVDKEAANHTPRSILRRLREVYDERGSSGLDDRIKYEFHAHITNARFTASDIKNQQALADLRYPSEWFPATRAVHRKIHLHVGPTNSGKTYHALKRLEQAKTGVYAGPLRLLAHEVYSRMNAKGISCALITGEERRAASDATPGVQAAMSACTVEMMPLNKSLDVAVIDEIQMIGNAERGWAWTQALIGVKAAEVHLCGEERTVPLIREICASLGEKVEIHRYQRLSPLKMAEESLDGDLTKLRKGDCVVSFSVIGIHSLRKQIERATGKKVAIVYGSLPPETRAQQARLFNDPYNDYDYLVASDAVGMGLNLAIKRIIFEASTKFDGYQHRTLSVADIKQIAGRAGRYRTAEQATRTEQDDVSKQSLAAAKGDTPLPSPAGASAVASENVGYVTTLQQFDFPVVATAMISEPEPIRTAGLFPPAAVLERFASYFPPGTPFSYILIRLHELSRMHTRFHLCGLRDQTKIADLIEPVQGLTISDRNVICAAPAGSSDQQLWKGLMPALAKCIADQSGGNLIDIEELPIEALEADVSTSREYLKELERLHKGVVCYLWLSYRFAGVFHPRALALHVKSLVEEKIEKALSQFSYNESQYKRLAAQREKAVLRDLEAAAMAQKDEIERKPEATGATGDLQEDEEDADAQTADGDKKGKDGFLREQTTLTAGGDHFGGGDELGLEDPIEREEDDQINAVGSFEDWRQQQTRGESQASHEYDLDTTVSDVIGEGGETHLVPLHGVFDETTNAARPASVGNVDGKLLAVGRLASGLDSAQQGSSRRERNTRSSAQQ